MTKNHIVIVLVVMGLFLMPSLTYACGMKSETSCCRKEVSSKGDKKECCKKDNGSNNKGHDGGCR